MLINNKFIAECKEYNNLYREVYPDPIFKDVCEYGRLECPTFSSNPTVVGGRDAEAFEYPSMVSIFLLDWAGPARLLSNFSSTDFIPSRYR